MVNNLSNLCIILSFRKIEFDSNDEIVLKKRLEHFIVVDDEKLRCDCQFFTNNGFPCKHMFVVIIKRSLPIKYVPISPRWLLSYDVIIVIK